MKPKSTEEEKTRSNTKDVQQISRENKQKAQKECAEKNM